MLWSTVPLTPQDFMQALRERPAGEWEAYLANVQARTDYQGLEQAALLGNAVQQIADAVLPRGLIVRVGPEANGETLFEHIKQYYDRHRDDQRAMSLMYTAQGQLGPLLQVTTTLKVEIGIPQSLRTQHHHIIGSPGTGKTECMKNMIWDDVQAGHCVVVIDGQGDLIRDIAAVVPAEKVVLVDPTDVEWPLCINLFDIGMDRIKRLTPTERERAINGAVDLFDFVFASLLDAELTSKQATAFRFVTRLMLEIPGATIKTVMQVMEPNGLTPYQKHVDKLGSVAQSFFRNEFNSKEFAETRRQVTRRLYALLGNRTFEAMFDNPKSKLNLYEEMDKGSIILINTAKDFLFSEHATFGRFFIAMLAQAVQQRATASHRKRTYIYIDECHEYFDAKIGTLLEQARKYEVGMVLAHQFLGQIDGKLRDALTSIPSIRFVSGVEHQDATFLARNMRSTAESIMRQPKGTFLAHFRDVGTVSWRVDIGRLSRLPQATPNALELMQAFNRKKYCRRLEGGVAAVPPPPKFDDEGDGMERSRW